MEDIGERHILYYFPGTEVAVPFGGLNPVTILNTLLVMGVLWLLMWLATRRLSLTPGRAQMAFETVAGGLDELVHSALELETPAQNRRFFPLVAALFAFLALANILSFLPGPWFEEPTADYNTTLALGLMGMSIAVTCGVMAKGFWGYFQELLGPMWQQAGIAPKLSALFFFPLNVIGELSKVLSISFRLFGNMIGSAVILLVVSHLVFYLVLPIGLILFFVFFIGIIQAFVFTMLTLTYIAVAMK